MNSRRSMGFPRAEGYAGDVKEYHDLSENLCRRSRSAALLLNVRFESQAQADIVHAMSALPPKPDIAPHISR